MIAFYTAHNPEKLIKVEKLLAHYKGREEVLLAKLKEKYHAAEASGVRSPNEAASVPKPRLSGEWAGDDMPWEDQGQQDGCRRQGTASRERSVSEGLRGDESEEEREAPEGRSPALGGIQEEEILSTPPGVSLVRSGSGLWQVPHLALRTLSNMSDLGDEVRIDDSSP